MNTCYIQSFKTLVSLYSWAGRFESYLVENPRRQVFAWRGSLMISTTIGKITFSYDAWTPYESEGPLTSTALMFSRFIRQSIKIYTTIQVLCEGKGNVFRISWAWRFMYSTKIYRYTVNRVIQISFRNFEFRQRTITLKWQCCVVT